MRPALIALAAAFVSACTAWPTVDAARCASRQYMQAWLTNSHGEQVAARGIGPEGVFELYTGGGSFTITRVLPTGVACIVATGSEWRHMEPSARGMGT